ncbi:MAG: hypothetical protein IT167_31660, partial [Bryobacterales bacterium]|nr:hypothetical protein [Bryobacterales bacterium]
MKELTNRGTFRYSTKVCRINRYHMEQFAAWMEKLDSIPEGDSTLLDNSMIVYGAGL